VSTESYYSRRRAAYCCNILWRGRRSQRIIRGQRCLHFRFSRSTDKRCRSGHAWYDRQERETEIGVQMWFSTPAFLLNMFQRANPIVDVVDIAPFMDELCMVKDTSLKR